MAEILTIGTSAATSADFTLTGQVSSIQLTGTSGVLPSSVVDIQVKSTGGQYTLIGQCTTREPLQVLIAPGTFRVSRPAGGPACGIDLS